MRAILTLARRAYAYYRTDDTRETWIAVILGMIAVGLTWWRVSRFRSRS